MSRNQRLRLGLALGSGSARGWAHIGIIQALHDAGYKPDIVCGTSVGALVGGAYAGGHLQQLQDWLLQLDKRDIFSYLDIRLLSGGGFVEGKKLIDFFRRHISDRKIEQLDKIFACVATDLQTGREVWFREGSTLEAIRASIALPGLFTPVKHQERWLVDGGLVNPVPISLCRALGADVVIAVNLNGDIVGKHLHKSSLPTLPPLHAEQNLLDKFANEIKNRATEAVSQWLQVDEECPGIFDVTASALNIMQDKITRSRMAGDPPDIQLTPKLAHIGLMDFDRAEEAINAGRRSVEKISDELNELMGS